MGMGNSTMMKSMTKSKIIKTNDMRNILTQCCLRLTTDPHHEEKWPRHANKEEKKKAMVQPVTSKIMPIVILLKMVSREGQNIRL